MKILKIVLLNLLFFIIFVLAVNAIFLFTDKKINPEKPFRMYIPYENHLYYLLRDRKYLRSPSGLQYKNKKPIVLYGGSFSYGYLLPEDESFGYLLAEKSKRTVYNYSIASRGLQQMLYFLEKDIHYDDFTAPDYVIYTFIDDHVRRLYTPCNANDNVEFIDYKKVNNDLIRNNSPLKYLHSLYIFNKLQSSIYNKFFKLQKENQNMDLVLLYFEKSKKFFEKHYPDTKFVILLYPTGQDNYIHSAKWKELEKDGFIVINANELVKDDLTKDEYKLDDKSHPNSKAWRLICDKLVKKLDL
ncbi:MAG: hypothetical protein K6C94_07320 [Candidatus Gastranaerophilales bacterium]|nr:hypothetical protein [Candidatus Gastranaerophilales bacterium]